MLRRHRFKARLKHAPVDRQAEIHSDEPTQRRMAGHASFDVCGSRGVASNLVATTGSRLAAPPWGRLERERTDVLRHRVSGVERVVCAYPRRQAPLEALGGRVHVPVLWRGLSPGQAAGGLLLLPARAAAELRVQLRRLDAGPSRTDASRVSGRRGFGVVASQVLTTRWTRVTNTRSVRTRSCFGPAPGRCLRLPPRRSCSADSQGAVRSPAGPSTEPPGYAREMPVKAGWDTARTGPFLRHRTGGTRAALSALRAAWTDDLRRPFAEPLLTVGVPPHIVRGVVRRRTLDVTDRLRTQPLPSALPSETPNALEGSLPLGRSCRQTWVPPAGLEPAAKRLEGACSIH